MKSWVYEASSGTYFSWRACHRATGSPWQKGSPLSCLPAGSGRSAPIAGMTSLAVTQCQSLGVGGGVVTDAEGLILQVLPVVDSDAEELADLAGRLRAEVLGIDAVSVVPLTAEVAPEGAKGLGTLAGWLAVQLGSLDGLRAVVSAVRGWTSRTGRTVEVSIGGDALKVTGVTSQQQERIVDAWLARHAPGG